MKKILITACLCALSVNLCYADAYYETPSTGYSAIQDYVAPDITPEISTLLKQASANPDNLLLKLKLAKLYDANGNVQEANELYSYLLIVAKDNFQILNELENVFKYKISRDNNNDLMHSNLAQVYCLQGKFDNAIKEYGLASSLNPANYNYKLKIADLYMQKNEYIKALQILDNNINSFPHDLKSRFKRAECYTIMGSFDKARDDYKAILYIQPSNFQAKIALYDLLKPKLTRDEVIKTMYPEYANSSVGISAYYKLASDLKIAKKYSDAIYFYKLVINIDPKYQEAYIDLADIYKETGDSKAALELMDGAQKNLSSASEIAKKYTESATKETQAEIVQPAELMKNGDYEKALPLYLAVNPPTVDSLVGVASCYQFLSKYDEALLYLNQAQNLEPQNSDVYYAFGFLFLNKEDFDNAKLNLENSLKYNPDNQKSKKLLLFVIDQENNKLLDKAFYYIDNKKYSDAMAVLDTAIKINPENSVNHYYKGSIHFLQHKYFLAIDEFQKTIKYNSDYAIAYYSLANSYDAVKNYKEAKLNYQKYISLSKEETPELIKAKARVEKIKD